jgi:O-antigen biosynthesis protein
VIGSKASAAIGRRRARLLRDAGHDALILDISFCNGLREARVIDPAGGVPQSLNFDLPDEDGGRALIDYLRAVNPSSFELINLDHLSPAALDRLLGLAIPYDMLVADFGSATGQGWITQPSNTLWFDAAASAHQIIAPSLQAYEFARDIVGATYLRLTTEPRTAGTSQRSERRVRCLGLVPARRDRDEFKLMMAIARSFRGLWPDLTLFVFGDTADDLALMQIGNCYVTGAVAPEELQQVSETYDVDAHLLCVTSPLFGHPATEFAFAASVPVAYFDWSHGGGETGSLNLALDPKAPLDQHVRQLSHWLQPL